MNQRPTGYEPAALTAELRAPDINFKLKIQNEKFRVMLYNEVALKLVYYTPERGNFQQRSKN